MRKKTKKLRLVIGFHSVGIGDHLDLLTCWRQKIVIKRILEKNRNVLEAENINKFLRSLLKGTNKWGGGCRGSVDERGYF